MTGVRVAMTFIRSMMLRPVRAVALAGGVAALSVLLTAFAQSAGAHEADAESGGPKPTIVLVHGAFADAAGWDWVVKRLQGCKLFTYPCQLHGRSAAGASSSTVSEAAGLRRHAFR